MGEDMPRMFDDLSWAFRRFCWAFLFLFDFSLGINGVSFDVLPDFVGWILFIQGLARLASHNQRAKDLEAFAKGLLAFSLVTLFQWNVKGGAEDPLWLFLWALETAYGVGLICFVCIFTKALIDIGKSLQWETFAAKAKTRVTLFATIRAAGYVLLWIPPLPPELILAVALIGVVLALVTTALMMTLMKHGEKESAKSGNISGTDPEPQEV